METTNLEISKKLKEIGFEAETDKCWAKIRNSKLDEFSLRALDFSILENCDQWYLAYYLETLIKALPKTYNKGDLKIWYYENKVFIVYQDRGGFIKKSIEKRKNESLADAAGRLIIELSKAGIINFKKIYEIKNI